MVPHSREAEEAVIGAVLINPEAYYDVAQFLAPDDFYIHRNKWIWETFVELHDRNEAIDLGLPRLSGPGVEGQPNARSGTDITVVALRHAGLDPQGIQLRQVESGAAGRQPLTDLGHFEPDDTGEWRAQDRAAQPQLLHPYFDIQLQQALFRSRLVGQA